MLESRRQRINSDRMLVKIGQLWFIVKTLCLGPMDVSIQIYLTFSWYLESRGDISH